MDIFRSGEPESPDAGFDDDADMLAAPPPVIGQDERRMQVRAYNYWASLLGKRRFPDPARLVAGELPDFAANAVVLRFIADDDDPEILMLGAALAAECGEDQPIARLSQVPGRSVLSRITDHYLQIIANEAPIGFEAEFVNARGATILYRGILLPFSSDDSRIDVICGVINWKELADPRTTSDLLQEISDALDRSRAADSPASDLAFDDTPLSWADGPAGAFDDDIAAPTPVLDLSPFVDRSEPHSLDEWLEKARALALRALASEDRTRQSLYAAIGRAWDFALAAEAAPADYARLLAQAGLVQRSRAPLLALVKLVFGADYDKTRLTEYATVLMHARRLGLARGTLAEFLVQAPGGLKAVISAERALRRGEDRAAPPRTRAPAWTHAARALPGRSLATVARDGAEFALVLIRRSADAEPQMLAEIADDPALIARAAKRITG